jgi:hypothetical protein
VLILVTVALMITASALLIVGFSQHAFTLVSVSVACGALAVLTLIAHGRVQRRRAEQLGATFLAARPASPPARRAPRPPGAPHPPVGFPEGEEPSGADGSPGLS